MYRCGDKQQCCETASRECCSIPTVYRGVTASWYIWSIRLSNIRVESPDSVQTAVN